MTFFGNCHPEEFVSRVPHLRDGLIVAKVGIRATARTVPLHAQEINAQEEVSS